MCIALPLFLSFYPILLGKCVFNIVKQRLCFHATSTTGNSVLTNNKKRLRDFTWQGAQDKCSVHGSWCGVPAQTCENMGAGQRWPLARASAVWKICCNREKKNQYQIMRQLRWLLRPLLVDLLRSSAGTMLLLYGNTLWRNGDASVMFLKDTELVSLPVKSINLGLHAPR